MTATAIENPTLAQLDEEWADAITKLAELHAKRSEVHPLNLSMVPFRRRQMQGVEFAHGSSPVAHIYVTDLLVALAELPQPVDEEPKAAPREGKPTLDLD